MVPDWIGPFLSPLLPWVRWLLRYSLFVALVQLLLAGVAAYLLTERWQRWRQRREFQYKTMSKLSETSMELFVLLSELFSIHPLRQAMANVWDDRQRRYITERVVFHALEADIMASFERADVLSDYYGLNVTAKELFDTVQFTGQINKTDYETAQEQFLEQRKRLLGKMIADMKLVSWRQRRALRRKKTTTTTAS